MDPVLAWTAEDLPTRMPEGERGTRNNSLSETRGNLHPGAASGGKTRVAKAVFILASAALALEQVMIMVAEYLSFPTNTLYLIKTMENVPSPAITICPNPSWSSSFAPRSQFLPQETFSEWRKKEISTIEEDFKNASVSFLKAVTEFPQGQSNDSTTYWENIIDNTTVNGETIYVIDTGTTWIERTFLADAIPDPLGGFYSKCFTLLRREPMPAGTGSCREDNEFAFDFKSLYNTTNLGGRMHMDVYIHDQREKFSLLRAISPIPWMSLDGDTVTNVFLRPGFVQQQSKRDDPCTAVEGYSYSRCMENCFWNEFLSRPDVSCHVPSLLTAEVTSKKPKCEDVPIEIGHLQQAKRAQDEFSTKAQEESRNCGCPKRCNQINYEIFADPTNMCLERLANAHNDTRLFVGIASKRVAHIQEKERVNLQDLLANIGGIVGVCLGFSLITVFDIVEQIFYSIRRKILLRRNEMTSADGHRPDEGTSPSDMT